ncbi:hypothetical protein [Zavarzinella formosa]|uniref:hypothetical protein n=1 Tax=Zavarzinella formosa TaxID=360055 RepID=UPI0002EF30C3|nr:hypothetical protein [Zavarzinella formosa]
MRTITVAGGDLFTLALQYLGDATQWNRIAQANGLIDPVLSGVNTLNIPSTNSNAGGGVFVPA